VLGVDQVVVGIGKDRLALLCTSPLGGGIGRGDELRYYWRRLAVSCIVEGFKIFTHSPARRRRVDILVPLRSWLRAALVGIGLDQARIDGKALTRDQPRLDAVGDDVFKELTEDVAVAEAFVAGARERRVVGHLVLDAEPAEPALGQVDLDLTHELAFGADSEDVAEDEHSQREFGVDRGAAKV
jgi:hypothetical protein